MNDDVAPGQNDQGAKKCAKCSWRIFVNFFAVIGFMTFTIYGYALYMEWPRFVALYDMLSRAAPTTGPQK